MRATIKGTSMNFQSIRNFLLCSFLVAQTVPAQVPGRASSSSTVQEQGPQKKASVSDNGDEKASAPDPLLNLLVTKGLLTSEEARTIISGGNPESQRDLLVTLLKDKGLISAAEVEQLRATPSNGTAVTAGAVAGEGLVSAPC